MTFRDEQITGMAGKMEDGDRGGYDINTGYGDMPYRVGETLQFSISKYFALTSFLAIGIITFALIFLYTKSLEDNLLKRSEQYAIALARNIAHHYYGIITENYSIPSTEDRATYLRNLLDSTIKEHTYGLNIEGFNIFDSKGRLLYEYESGLLLFAREKNGERSNIKEALKGSLISRFYKKVLGNHTFIRSIVPIKDDKGESLGVFDIYQDVTDIYEQIKRSQFFIVLLSVLIMGLLFTILSGIVRKAESILNIKTAEIEGQSRYLNAILSNMGNAVVVIDNSHNIRYMNEQAIKIFGKRKNLKCYEAFLGAEKPCKNCHIRRLIKGRAYKAKGQRKDKKGRIFEVTSSFITDQRGEPLLIEIFNDITSIIAAQEERERFREMLEKERMDAIRELITSLKHKINNSLTGLTAIIDYLNSVDTNKPQIEGEDVYLLMKEEVEKMKGVLKRLSQLKVPVTSEYIEGERMIDIDREVEN